MGVKMNFRIITKNHAADSKIGSPQKIDSKAVMTKESNPTAWELNLLWKNDKSQTFFDKPLTEPFFCLRRISEKF